MKSFKEYLNKKTLSPEELAKKHNVSLDKIHTAIKQGEKVELEHTNNRKIANEIARDHIGEYHDYYDKLKKVEKK